MKIKKSLAALTATVSIMALATGCSSSGSSGVVDTQADKGLAVMGDTITYDPNHLVNDGQPIELGYWSWGDESTDPVISMLHEYEKIHPNVTFKISQVAWSDYWVKTPLSLKGNKNAPVLFNVHNSEDALLRPARRPPRRRQRLAHLPPGGAADEPQFHRRARQLHLPVELGGLPLAVPHDHR